MSVSGVPGVPLVLILVFGVDDSSLGPTYVLRTQVFIVKIGPDLLCVIQYSCNTYWGTGR